MPPAPTSPARLRTDSCEAGASLPRVEADRKRVLQVLGNLIGNALKFTPAGGRVEVGAEADGGEARIWVADSGVGSRRSTSRTSSIRTGRRSRRTAAGSGWGSRSC
ncbi:MAG TPA: ATP-binding protein, partial [Longimicrobiaceae bacterium]